MTFEEKIKSIAQPLAGSMPSELTYNLSVKLKFEGYTLLDMYAELFPHQSKEKWEEKINDGSLTVNGEKVKPNTILKAGWMTQNTVINKVEPEVNVDIKLIEENDDFLVINKPSPLPIHPAGRFYKNTLTEILKLAFPKNNYKITHRIDANTTGIVILAKNKSTANLITKQFESQTIKKEYLALVEGHVKQHSFNVVEHISKHKTKAGGREIVEEGVKAETMINVVKHYENSTLLSIQPKSGRTNQIRLHLASIGHPIVGDLGYKNQSYFENHPLTYPTDCLYLHAHKISFNYNNQILKFVADVPEKFKTLSLKIYKD